MLEGRRTSRFGGRVRDISFELRRGEILGVAGLVGSGRTELALTIFGITPGDVGHDRDRRQAGDHRARPKQARNLGIAYVPEDRGLQGLVRPMTIAPEHLDGVAAQRRARHLHRRRAAKLQRGRATRSRKLGIRARGPEQVVGQLSGGNQQKVVLGKWLETEPRILIMDEPTRGIDVGAKAEIHALMCRLAQRGHGDPDDLERTAGSARHERPGAGDAWRPDGRRPSTAPTPPRRPSAPP